MTELKDVKINVKVNTRRLKEKLEEKPDLENMTPTALENYIREHIDVVLIGSPEEKRFYLTLEEEH